jgi:hypothetical protein
MEGDRRDHAEPFGNNWWAVGCRRRDRRLYSPWRGGRPRQVWSARGLRLCEERPLIVTLILLSFWTAGWLVAQSAAVSLPRDVAHDAYALYSYIYQHSNSLYPNEVIAVVQDVAPFRNDDATRRCVKPQTGDERAMVDKCNPIGPRQAQMGGTEIQLWASVQAVG